MKGCSGKADAKAPKPSGTRRSRKHSQTRPDEASFDFEKHGLAAGHQVIAGVDEAGRGPWAGPVVAAAVILDPTRIPQGIADSKKLTEARREELFEEILKAAKFGIAFADPERIDRDNILAATMWSMQRAVAELAPSPDLVLVDGNRAPQFDCRVQTIVKGDAKSLSIAAASIIAKVTRDRMMIRFDAQYPGYGFASHKGYGTAAHQEALQRLGPTPLHRRSFKPVRTMLELNGAAGRPRTTRDGREKEP
jgi:ribonuclease HII